MARGDRKPVVMVKPRAEPGERMDTVDESDFRAIEGVRNNPQIGPMYLTKSNKSRFLSKYEDLFTRNNETIMFN